MAMEFSGLKIKPLGDRVLVRIEKQEKKTKSGLVIPDTAQEKPQIGTVVAVGTGRILENGQKLPLEVKVNDKVIFSKYAGTEVKIDDVDHLLLSIDDILAIVEG